MSTALQSAKDLRVKIRDAKSRSGNVNTLRAWKPVREKVEVLLADVEILSKSALLLSKTKEVGLLTKHLPTLNELKNLQAKLDKLDNRLTDEPDALLKGDVWASTKTQLDGLAHSLRDNLTSVWVEHLKGLGQSIDYLEPFARVEQCTSIIRKIKLELESLTALTISLPQDAEPLRRAIQHQKEIQKLVSQLDLKDVPPAVQKFLKAINTSGVTLNDVTDEVHTWLAKKNMLKSFHVRAS
jgi:hypothetical protein